MDDERPGLGDPDYAAFAWRRYWRIMRWMALVALACVLGALGLIWWRLGTLPLHLAIAAAAGIGFTALLTAALMGLMFLSSGTGHDEQVEDLLKDEMDENE